MDISEQIRYWRKSRNMTQAELAEKAQISLSSLKRYESGDSSPYFDTISKLASVLNVPLTEFIYFGDPPAETTTEKMSQLDHKLKWVGCSIKSKEGLFWIEFSDGVLPISEEELNELNRVTNSYIQLKLNELRLFHSDKFQKNE